MKVLHLTPKTNGYEVVTLIADKVNEHNHLSVIESDGLLNYTGGLILVDNVHNRQLLDSIPKDKTIYDYITR